MSGTVLFLCPHNAAKSLIAVALFATKAEQRGLDLRADSAGTDPDAAPAAPVVTRLATEGVDFSGHRPRLVTADDLTGALRVVSIGCDVTALAPTDTPVESWDDVPPPSQDLDGAFETIRAHVARLVAELDKPA